MDDLWIERRGVSSVEFSVLEGPRHGVIQLVDATSTENATTFSDDDVRQRRVRYRHDDSESQEDSFRFSAELRGTADLDDDEKVIIITSNHFKVIWEERVAKAPLVTMGRPKFTPQSWT